MYLSCIGHSPRKAVKISAKLKRWNQTEYCQVYSWLWLRILEYRWFGPYQSNIFLFWLGSYGSPNTSWFGISWATIFQFWFVKMYAFLSCEDNRILSQPQKNINSKSKFWNALILLKPVRKYIFIYLDDCSDHNRLIRSLTQAGHTAGHIFPNRVAAESRWNLQLLAALRLTTRTAIWVGLGRAHMAKISGHNRQTSVNAVLPTYGIGLLLTALWRPCSVFSNRQNAIRCIVARLIHQTGNRVGSHLIRGIGLE